MSRPRTAPGTPIAAPDEWSFTTTGDADQYPLTLWDTSATPVIAAENESQPVEVGLKFFADEDGHITAVRFYKGAGNDGAHVAHLWSVDGTLLATATSAVESGDRVAAGQLRRTDRSAGGPGLRRLVPRAGRALLGRLAAFDTTGVDRGALHALRAGHRSAATVCSATARPGSRASTWNGANYWVDVVFVRPARRRRRRPSSTRSPAAGLVSVGARGTGHRPVQRVDRRRPRSRSG